MLQIPLLLLCAGKSTRFGSPKGLALFQGHTWLRQQILSFAQYSEAPIFIVLGASKDLYEKELDKIADQTGDRLLIERLVNPDHESATFTSIHLGAKTLIERGLTAAFIQPIDTPVPQPLTLKAMSSAARNYDVVVPAFLRAGGHPVLVAHDFLKAITLADPLKKRLDHMIRDWPPERYLKLETNDPRVNLSFNSPEEYEKLCKFVMK